AERARAADAGPVPDQPPPRRGAQARGQRDDHLRECALRPGRAGPRGRGPPRPGRTGALGGSRTGVRPPAGADPALRDVRRRAVAALHDEVALDDRGRAAFVGASTAVFARTGETLAHLVGAGDVVLGRTVAGVDGPALGGGDCIAFRALFVGGGAAIAERCGGSVRAVAQVGQAAPGGRSFRGFGSDVALGGGGWLAFTAVLDDGTTGVFVADPDGSLGEVTRTGALSPVGGAFTSLRVIGVAGAGTVAFRGAVTSGPDGLFSWDGSALGRIAV